MVENRTTPLTGKPLLQKVKELSDLPRRETAKLCGYYTLTKSEETRVNLTDFYDAILAAKGVPLDKSGNKDGRGREPTYRVSVHKNGQIVIGATYTETMGLKFGRDRLCLVQLADNKGTVYFIQIDKNQKNAQRRNPGRQFDPRDQHSRHHPSHVARHRAKM